MKAELAAGRYVSAGHGKVKFAEYAEQWRQAQVHRDATEVLTERAFQLYVNPHIGHLPLTGIKPSRVQAMVKALSDELSPAFVHIVYGYVASVMKAAVRDRVIGRSPCEGIRLPEVPKRPAYVPTVNQVEEVASYLPDYYRAVPLIAARSGLRPSELLGLEVGSIDFLRREIHVTQQLVTTSKKGNAAYLAPPKTRESVRTVPVDQECIDLIAAHLAKFPATDAMVLDSTDLRRPKTRPARLLFLSATGAPVKRTTWSGAWQPAARKAGFPARTGLHCCRHFSASALIRFGESVKTVQAALGHSSPAITLGVYAHLRPDSDDRVRAAIIAAFTCAPDVHSQVQD
ncbi:MAG TPA: site-specific integrase [Trebonia sp.]